MIRRRSAMPVVATVALTLGLVAPGPVAAECTGLDPWPSFTAAAQSAKVIVVGEVVESFGDDSADNAIHFGFRVDQVLRGKAKPELEFHDVVRSGLPLTICPGDSLLRVRVGDQLAMAFGARYVVVDGPVTAVAFLNRTPNSFLMPEMERLTREQVHAIADLPATDTNPRPVPGGTGQTLPLGLLLVGLIGGWLADRRLGKRAR